MGRGFTSVVSAGGRPLITASIEPRSSSPSSSFSAVGGIGVSLPLSRAPSGGGRLLSDGVPRGMSGMGRRVTSVVAEGGRSLTAASIEPRSASQMSGMGRGVTSEKRSNRKMWIHSSQTTHQSVELFGRQLQIMLLIWQTQMMMIVVIRTKLEFVISTEHVGSCRIIAD